MFSDTGDRHVVFARSASQAWHGWALRRRRCRRLLGVLFVAALLLVRRRRRRAPDRKRHSCDIVFPLSPFMGIMAVAPANPVVGEPGVTVPGVQRSRPPGVFGGNMDVKDLGVGTRLYLPVFHAGALFYTGDPHSAQGDGEVSGTAIEHSLTGTFRFIVHKGRTTTIPWAETATHYVLMGIDLDLDRAMRIAVQEVVKFLVTEKGLEPGYAYSLASVAVDFHVGEAVDLTQIVTGKIPKSIFRGR